ncbi:polysaccharide export protein [Methylosinus sp. H3A]|uniref:polysaccharide biosynthesis/export family protein n=1 Tax=Methylosinus sp. H3A TaxID=2785786 RepID=UPI0018C25C5E|nr:polysaccharide biosynthesis/export family protein [Methylosinus sp. H3A]MBG0809350.1 polysaccharide export protein [Methylosinus sp. H3A]
MIVRISRKPALVAACVVSLSACATGELGAGADPSYTASLPEPDTARANSDFTQSDYRISPQDILEINIFGFSNLSRVAQVDGNGRISFPLIGGVAAAGRTVSELETEITRKLAAKYLQSPQVSVFVKESVGLRVTVEGAVRKPGIYALKGKSTLLQALVMAEGINDVGDSAVTLIRVSDQRRISAKYDVSAIRSGQLADPLVYGGDTIIVDESLGRTGVQVLKSAVPAMLSIGAKPW